MRFHVRFSALAGVLLVFAAHALAHPGSGIEVDRRGGVYFQDTLGRTLWRVDPSGRLTRHAVGLGGHWMTADPEGAFSRERLKHFERVPPAGDGPALLVADGGAPLVVGGDGNLYFGANDALEPGATQVARMTPDGTVTPFSPALRAITQEIGITGLAAGPDGSLYVSSASAVLRVARDGAVTTLARPVEVKDCDHPEGSPRPQLRGLAVDARGNVYAAASGCQCVVKISPAGAVTTVLKSEPPWAPTGVALHEGEVYVLEYTHAQGAASEGWRPRVRKLGRDGTVRLVAEVPG